MTAATRFDANDAAALARAVELAELGRGAVEPNPPVGAVLYRGGEILAEGFHREYGEAHAEVDALARLVQTAQHARTPRDASLAVTLEPCSAQDAQKKQPPCVDALLRMQVARVVIGELDPDPRQHGRGLAALERAGVDVIVAPDGAVPAGLLAEFRDVLRRDRPYVLLKWAQCLDGRWSSGRPDQPWISSEESRRAVHRLRAHVDAILVGSGTVLADDPHLTARPSGARPLLRVVVDGRARAPAGAKVFRTVAEGPVLWVTGRDSRARTPDGVERLELAAPHDLAGSLLPALAQRGARRLLVEGGPTIAAAFLDAGLVDRGWVFVAPVIHGRSGPERAPALGAAEAQLATAMGPRVEAVERSGCDAWLKLSWR